MEDIVIEDIDIPIKEDNISLKGTIYFSSETPSRAPFIVIFPALWAHRGSKLVKFFTDRFANSGYYVLAYDYRAHGETAKQTRSNWVKHLPKIFSDVHIVISWILDNQTSRLLNDNIVLFGRSFGGAITLTNGFIDERAKQIIALGTRYDYRTVKRARFSEDHIKLISPKHFLRKDALNNKRILIAHCRDDDVIPFENFRQIKEHLGLNHENTLEFETGGHTFRGHREDIIEYTNKFLKRI